MWEITNSLHYWLCSMQEIIMPDLLYDEVIEVEERIVLKQDKCALNILCPTMTASTGEQVCHKAWYCKTVFGACFF